MPRRECFHCKQWVQEGQKHDCWTTTEAALTRELAEDLRDAWERRGRGPRRTAIAAQNIGKPAVVSGECEADIRSMIQSLAPGTYIATVTAFNTEGSAQSAASAPFTR